jgi:hypothetical protein
MVPDDPYTLWFHLPHGVSMAKHVEALDMKSRCKAR